MKKLLLAIATMFYAGVAGAQLTGNMNLTTDYRFRGLSQTQNSAAVQGGIDYAHKSGFYVGNWNSSISSDLYNAASGLESDVYGGVRTNLAKGIAVDVGVYAYMFPRAALNGKKYDTQEVYAGIVVGPLSAKVSQSLNDYFGAANSQGTRYYQVGADIPVIKNLTLQAHAGRTDVANSNTADYTDYRVGATYDQKGWLVGAHYVTVKGYSRGFEAANTVNGQQLYKDTVVVSVGRKF